VGVDLTGLPANGSLARTVRDAAALLDAMAGPVPGDVLWATRPDRPFVAYADEEPGRLRVGRYRTPVISDDAVVHPECVTAYEEASALVASLGHDVEDINPPFAPEMVPRFELVWSVLSMMTPVDPSREGELRPLTRWLRERGRAASATQFTAALAEMHRQARAAVAASLRYDVVLTPTLADLPALVGGLRDDADPVADFEAQKRFTPFTAAYNVTGQPALSLPLYWTADELPVGVMIVGRPADEPTLIRLAAQLEAAKPWANRKPPMW
jgi:amidase